MNEATRLRVQQANQAARQERLKSPATVQGIKAVRAGGVAAVSGTGLEWAYVVEAPLYEIPGEQEGRSYYTLRPLGSLYTTWNSEASYEIDDIVVYPTINDGSYRCILSPPPGTLPTNETYWEKREEIKVEYAIGHESPARDVRDCIPWFKQGSIVPYCYRYVLGNIRYYLLLHLIYTGAEADSGLRFDPDNDIVQAVFV
ncbi:MAG: hypothetical protein WCZ89_06215 [Phycisphaerae bacterium]